MSQNNAGNNHLPTVPAQKYQPDEKSKALLYDSLSGKIERNIRHLEELTIPHHEEQTKHILVKIVSIAQQDKKTVSGRLEEILREFQGPTTPAMMAIWQAKMDQKELQTLKETWS